VRSHKIQNLSAGYARAIYAAEIEADLRVVFYFEGNTVVTVDIWLARSVSLIRLRGAGFLALAEMLCV
jgi:hypothetical protein